METAINIYTPVPNVVVHSANKSAQVQARGRIRNDIENLYVLTPDTRYIDLTDRRINDFFNKPLDVEQKAALVQVVGLKDVQHYRLGLDNVYVSFTDGKDYVCHVYSMNTVDILTRSNYPYGTGAEKTKLYESMASDLKEHGLPIASVFVMWS